MLAGPLFMIGKKIYNNNAYKHNDANVNFGEIDYCINNFKFPPQHPQKGIVYSCCDYEPDFYIPVSSFHQHTLQLKESAFIEMCAHLGLSLIHI